MNHGESKKRKEKKAIGKKKGGHIRGPVGLEPVS